MTDLSAIARANSISVEAILTGHAKRADGGLNLRFKIHPHGIPTALQEAPIGTRYVVALVEVDEHEQPVSPPAKEAQHTQKSPDTNPEQPASVSLPARVRKELTLAQRCAIACTSADFQQFLRQTFNSIWIVDENTAATFVRDYCHVKSRSEITFVAESGVLWVKLFGDYLIWREADRYVESA